MGACMRNPSFVKQLCLLVAAHAAICAVAYVLAGATAALAAGVSMLVSCGLFALFSIARFREIQGLSSEVDRVLHTGRPVDFADCREGDVAVLRNEVLKMTAQLHRNAAMLEQEKAALADALADVSHQIRTPLTAIELMVPVIEQTSDENVRVRKLKELERMIDRVSWLIAALLKMAKIDAGAIRFQNKLVGVADVLEKALEPLRVALEVREIECVIEVQEGASFTGDAAWLAEAVENIVKNCMEHTPAGGVITVQASEDAVATRMCVSDTGYGIAEDDLPHVFERFYRGRTSSGAGEGDAESRPAALSQGFGIGLSLAQSLVCAQGGTLRARNLERGGACFEMTFPKLVV